MMNQNNIKYSESQWINTSIFVFDKPDDANINKIKDILETAAIRPFKESKLTTHLPDGAFKGTIKKVMNRLKEVLLVDYEENYADEDITFEYHVYMSNQQPDAIHIKTRLFHPEGKSGDVLYGRMVQRIAKNKYLLWVDD